MAESIEGWFERFNDEYLKFEHVENKLSRRPDLHAFLLLDKLVSPAKERDMICGAAHDEIFLDVDLEKLAAVATDNDIRDLVRCGVRVDEYGEGLAMFA